MFHQLAGCSQTAHSKFRRTLGALVFGLGSWQLLALAVQAIRGVPFPTPWDCFVGLLDLLGGSLFLEHTIYQHLYSSCGRWFYGFIIALTAGISYAFLASRCQLFRAISMPTVEVLQLIPGLAWIPVAILLLGLSPLSAVAIIVLTTFPIIAISGVAGFDCADVRYVRTGLMCGYGPWGMFRTVYLPAALPHLLNGTRIALGASWRVLVAAEMVIGSGSGLGYAIIQSRWTMDYVAAFICILIIALIGLGLERLILLPVERHTLQRWGLGRER